MPASATPPPRVPHPRHWGYAGVYPGEFGVWKGDVLRNRLVFAAVHGFDGTGVGARELMEEPARFRLAAGLVEQHGLGLNLHPSIPWLEADPARYDAALADLRAWLPGAVDALGVRLISTGVGPVHRFLKDPSLATQMHLLRTRLPALVELAGGLGLRVGLENHVDYYLADLAELCGSVPGLGIFLDTGNCFNLGENPVAAVPPVAHLVVGTHFKDFHVDPSERELSLHLTGAALGDGDCGLATIYATLLREHPDPASLVMEVELIPDRALGPWESLERTKTFLERITGGDRAFARPADGAVSS